MLEFSIPLTFRHRAFFTRDIFCAENQTLLEAIDSEDIASKRILCVIEQQVASSNPQLVAEAQSYLTNLTQHTTVLTLNGGEGAKNSSELVDQIHRLVNSHHIDRHSYILCLGGGAFLDAVGFGTATAHRGIRLIRLPSTTLSQCDSGVGVKNGINLFGKKNFTGTFGVPWAVVNDIDLLTTQPKVTREVGLVEALKVSLIKDAEFFEFIAAHTDQLNAFDPDTVESVIKRSAELHMAHIATAGDPFELGSSRPLDFGHWSAHKLEQLTDFTCSHAEAVSIGVALDVLYSVRIGLLSQDVGERILNLMATLGYSLWHDTLQAPSTSSGKLAIFDGIAEFREHLGGQLTVMMLTAIGSGKDVHEIDEALMTRCITELKALSLGSLCTAPAFTPCSGASQAPTATPQRPSTTRKPPTNKHSTQPKRLNKITIQSPIFFITTCTQDRRKLLANDAVHAAFKQFCKTGITHGVWVGNYVIMPDHLHLFVAFDNNAKADISDWMRLLKRELTIEIRKTDQLDVVWQKGFFDHVLRSNESYAEKWDYISENPTRRGLVGDSADWPYAGEITALH